jgi:hypothetical protein
MAFYVPSLLLARELSVPSVKLARFLRGMPLV